MSFKRVFLALLGVGLLGTGVYKWDKARKLDNYFVEQFALDWETQVARGEPNCHGEIFDSTVQEMKYLGYNPQEIKDIMVKGFDRGNEHIAVKVKEVTSSLHS